MGVGPIASGGSGGSVPAASTTVAGKVELATNAEATTGTDTARAVTPAGVRAAIATVVGAAPAALDTLAEIATSLNDDEDFAGTITTALAGKVSLPPDPAAGDVMTWDGSAWVSAAGYQPLDADLTAIAGLATTTFGRSLLITADADALATSLATRKALTSRYVPLAAAFPPTAALAQTVPRSTPFSNASPLVSGRQSFVRISLLAGTPISSITFVSGTTALVGGSNQWFTVYDKNRNKLAVTLDDTSTAWGANTAKTLVISGGCTVPTTDDYYLGIMVNASTVPTLACVANGSASVPGIAPIVSGMDATNTGLTTPASAPATAAALTAQTMFAYAYVS